ncbi:MAG: hypothetical protein QME81_13675 [bacterium]|nr:hypothetical protein [bacterium]
MEKKSLYERFIKCDWPRQVGNLASTLARLSSLSAKPDYDDISRNLLREAALLIEWCAPNVPENLQTDLAVMQRELCYWYNIPLQAEIRKLLSLRGRVMSDYLLHASGLG